jgi:hypothetical protein
LNNDGDCDFAIWYIIGYTLSIFVIQYTVNSIMHHRYIRYVQYLYSIMVPITFLAFLAAMPDLENSRFTSGSHPFTGYDEAGMITVAIGVFLFNFSPEKPQEVCILENEFNNNLQQSKQEEA